MDKPKQYIVFNMDGEDYGIDIAVINEISRLREFNVMRFPKAPNYVEGVTSLRGEVIPIINLRIKIGLPKKDYDKDTRVIVIRLEKKTIGIIVDNIQKTVDYEEDEISGIPDGIKDVNTKYVKFVGKKDEDIITILDVNEILNIHNEDR